MTCMMFRGLQRRLYRIRFGRYAYNLIFVERRYKNNHTLGIEVFQLISSFTEYGFRKLYDLTANIEGDKPALQGADTAFIDVRMIGREMRAELENNGIAHPTGDVIVRDGRPYPLYRFDLRAIGAPAPERGMTVNGIPAKH